MSSELVLLALQGGGDSDSDSEAIGDEEKDRDGAADDTAHSEQRAECPDKNAKKAAIRDANQEIVGAMRQQDNQPGEAAAAEITPNKKNAS